MKDFIGIVVSALILTIAAFVYLAAEAARYAVRKAISLCGSN
jgi:hypothetical protein